MRNHRLEDQGEWERCRSSRRMFLALTDAGKGGDLHSIAQDLLRRIERSLPEADRTREARFFWENGLTEADPRRKGPPKELADRVYLVMRCVSELLDKHRRLAPYGGEIAICGVIRQFVPLAPRGFCKVAKLEGGPMVTSDSIRLNPFKTIFKQVGRDSPETVGEILA